MLNRIYEKLLKFMKKFFKLLEIVVGLFFLLFIIILGVGVFFHIIAAMLGCICFFYPDNGLLYIYVILDIILITAIVYFIVFLYRKILSSPINEKLKNFLVTIFIIISSLYVICLSSVRNEMYNRILMNFYIYVRHYPSIEYLGQKYLINNKNKLFYINFSNPLLFNIKTKTVHYFYYEPYTKNKNPISCDYAYLCTQNCIYITKKQLEQILKKDFNNVHKCSNCKYIGQEIMQFILENSPE